MAAACDRVVAASDATFATTFTTVGLAGNPAGGTASGRIDGTVAKGPVLPGDDAIKAEDDQNSKVDKVVKGICRGC